MPSTARSSTPPPRVVELWQHEDALALHEAGAPVAWVGCQDKGSHFCLDSRRLVEGRGLGPDWTDADCVSWSALQTLIARPTGPRVVAVWTSGSTRIRRPVGRPPWTGQLERLSAVPGPVALRYLSPNGARLPVRLLRLDQRITRGEAELVLAMSTAQVLKLVNGGRETKPDMVSGVMFGHQWALEPVRVWELAASERRPGRGHQPDKPVRPPHPLSATAQEALELLRSRREAQLGPRTSLEAGTVHVACAYALVNRGLACIDQGRVRLLPSGRSQGAVAS